MSSYTYDLPTSFSGGLNKKHLILDLQRDLSKFSNIFIFGDTMKLMFNSSLTSQEENVLSSLVSSHDPSPLIPREKFFSINPHVTQIKNNYYTSVFTFEYPGSFHIGTINYINVIAKSKNSTNDFDIRVMNQTHFQILCEKTNQNNTEYQSIDLGTISNVPEEPTLLEIQIKSESKKWVYVTQAIIYYGN